MTEALFTPACSITRTKRGRWFWAAWWTGAPVHVPFRKPDAEGGAARTPEEARAAAEARSGRPLAVIDPWWARAWMRVLRGQEPWPSRASREPRAARERAPGDATGDVAGDGRSSIWRVLGVPSDVDDEGLKAAYRLSLIHI